LEQLRHATFIWLLRRAGMPLTEIRRFLVDPTPARLDEYERALEDELDERREVLRYIRRLLEEGPMFDVQTKHVVSSRMSAEQAVSVSAAWSASSSRRSTSSQRAIR
jgi:DNA-binding transcriptional MerR regulator